METKLNQNIISRIVEKRYQFYENNLEYPKKLYLGIKEMMELECSTVIKTDFSYFCGKAKKAMISEIFGLKTIYLEKDSYIFVE